MNELDKKLFISALKVSSEANVIEKIFAVLMLSKKEMLSETETEILWSKIEVVRSSFNELNEEIDSVMSSKLMELKTK